MLHADQSVKVYFVPGAPPKARVEVKTRSKGLVTKEFERPFTAWHRRDAAEPFGPPAKLHGDTR
jgi:hypothetical protein